MNDAPTLASSLAMLLTWTGALAQGPGPGVTQDWSKVEQRIAWHGTWESGLAAAEATQRPILLIAAAPHCGLVPGMW
ncbi:MAG: hypothetical protein AAF628_16170 [Planctomycetota bacterium]